MADFDSEEHYHTRAAAEPPVERKSMEDFDEMTCNQTICWDELRL